MLGITNLVPLLFLMLNEVKSKKPNITNLATTTALRNKIKVLLKIKCVMIVIS